MKFIRPPFFLRWFSPEYLVCEMPAGDKVIYLTFDDGPVPDATPEVAEILRKFNVRATFFMVGDNVRKYPALAEMITGDGHACGNHTFHHLNGWQTSPGAYAHDVSRCSELVKSRLFRPPYGRFTPSQYFLLRTDYKIVLWSVLTYDFHRNTTPEQCLDIALNNTCSGSVVVFHDHPKAMNNLRYALPRFLEHFLGLGYRFECLE